MNWISTMLGIIAVLFGGLNIFQFLFFRSTKKEYESKAAEAEIKAKDARFESLQRQINNMESLYRTQGEELKHVREELLDITKKKMESDKRVAQLEVENNSLKEKVERLEKEVGAYKIIAKTENNTRSTKIDNYTRDET